MGLMKRSDIFTIYLQGGQKYGTQMNTNNFFCVCILGLVIHKLINSIHALLGYLMVLILWSVEKYVIFGKLYVNHQMEYNEISL